MSNQQVIPSLVGCNPSRQQRIKLSLKLGEERRTAAQLAVRGNGTHGERRDERDGGGGEHDERREQRARLPDDPRQAHEEQHAPYREHHADLKQTTREQCVHAWAVSGRTESQFSALSRFMASHSECNRKEFQIQEHHEQKYNKSNRT